MGSDSIYLVKSKLALVRTLTVGHANCVNTPERINGVRLD